MNEAETRAELIDPKLKESGWGVEELDQEKLPELLTLKYHALTDAAEILGGGENIRTTFIDFQKYLYERKAA